MSFDGKDLNDKSEEQFEEKLRQQTENVEVPESLSPGNIEKMLNEKASKKRSRRPVYTIAAAAACCIIVVGIAAFGGRMQDTSDTAESSGSQDTQIAKADEDGGRTPSMGENKIASAKDYDEIYEYIKAEQKNLESMQKNSGYAEESVMDGAANTGSASGSAKMAESAGDVSKADQGVGSYSDTNIRQEGVEEGDIVKTDGKRLYILNGQKIEIVSIEKEEMEQLSTIRLEDDQYISEIYVKDDKVVVVYTRTEYVDGADGYGGNYKEFTVAETYDVSNPEKPESIGKVTQSGNFYTMRVSGDYVYLFSNFSAYTQAARNEIDAYIPQVQGKTLDSADILLPQYRRGSQYTVISSFSLKDPEKKAGSKAVFGSPGLVYVSNSNIYVCESYYNSDDSDVTQTCIRKVSYQNGELKAVGQTRIDGTLNDSFSIDEYKGNLRLVTTVSKTGNGSAFPIVLFGKTGLSGGSEEKDTNSLYVLDSNLKELGKIDGLAKDERVYSARFMGDTGYFVTYKQMDPLFSVDLSDPKQPKIMGELKIPGFSDYLHPYGDGLLLGIGMDVDETGTTTEGVKLSMFDVSDPENVKEVKKYVLKDIYSTNVSYNYKAALISTDRNLIGFSAYGQSQHYYLFSYDEKEGFKMLFDRELSGYTEGRGVYSGDMLYIVSGNTVESYTMDTFQKIDDIVL